MGWSSLGRESPALARDCSTPRRVDEEAASPMTTSRSSTAPYAATAAPGPFASLAAVQVACVTADATLADALRAAAPSVAVATAATPFELADLLLSGACGVLVMDLAELGTSATTVIHHLANQFPDVPIIGIGTRHDEAEVAGLISTGEVYRFLHRPLSAARARTFIEAALRRHEELRPTAQTLKGAASHPSTTGPITRRLATASRHAHLTATLTAEQNSERAWYQSMPLVSMLAGIAVAVVALALGLTLRDSVGRSAAPHGEVARALAPGRTAVRGLLRPVDPRKAAPATRRAIDAAARPRPAVPPLAAVAAPAPAATVPATATATATEGPAGDALKKIHGAKAEYPEAAATTGVEGWVDVHFTVSPEGVPQNITVTGADPRDLFEQAAIAAVAQWRYAPRQAAAETDNRIHFKPPDAAPALAVTSDPPKG